MNWKVKRNIYIDISTEKKNNGKKGKKSTGDKWDSGKSLTCINWTFSSEREEREKCGRINTGTINGQEFSKTGKRYQPQIQEAPQTQTRINKIIIQTKTIQTTIQTTNNK